MRLTITITMILISMIVTSLFAQAPLQFNYQAMLRDDAGQPMASEEVSVEVAILQGAPDGTVVFSETHDTETNEMGLVNLQVGSLESLEDVVWDDAPHYIQISVDGHEMGTTQLLSVPYALHAQTSADAFSGDYEDLENLPDLSAFIEIGSPGPGDLVIYGDDGWTVIPVGQEGEVLQVTDGQPQWQNISDEFVSCGDDITFMYRGEEVTYGTQEKHGLCWMDRNLGAAQVPTAMDDPDGYGDLFQWGRLDDGHQDRGSATKMTLSEEDVPGHDDFILAPDSPFDWRDPQNNDLWQGVDGINNPCPEGWRLPTETELANEAFNWSTEGAVGAFDSPLKWPSAGGRDAGTGELDTVGEGGFVWSTDVSGIHGRALLFFVDIDMTGSYARARGKSVRCVMDITD